MPFMGISAPRRMSRPVCAVGALTERPQSPGGRSSPLFCLETHRIFGTALVSEPCWICLRQIAFVPNAGRLTLRVRAAPTAFFLLLPDAWPERGDAWRTLCAATGVYCLMPDPCCLVSANRAEKTQNHKILWTAGAAKGLCDCVQNFLKKFIKNAKKVLDIQPCV